MQQTLILNKGIFMSVGQKYLSNAGQEFIVLSEFRKKHLNREHTKWIVQFVETGTTREVVS